MRPPSESLDRWVFSPDGMVLTEKWARQVYGPRNITVYVFDPSAPAISAKYFPPKLFNGLKCPPKAAKKKIEPKAASKKAETKLPKKKKDAEEPEPAKPKKREREAEERNAEQRAAKEREAKRERERREEQAREEERRLWRERARPKVLPRHGVTAAWPSKVLPDQKTAGVTATWSPKVLPETSTLPRSGTPLCKAPAPIIAGSKESAATMAVREPILKALLNYKKAKTELEKEAHRRKLRQLFESIGNSAAQPFEAMLSTQNALAVTFRDALRGDPLENELLGILTNKYAPVAAQCIPAAPTPPPQSGVTLPGVTLTDEGSFDVLHADLEQRITALREGCGRIVRFNMKDAKSQLLKLVSVLSNLLARAQRSKVAAFAESDAAKRAAGLKNAGAAYTGLFYVTELSKLYVNIALVTDSADAAGVPSSISDKPEDNPLAKLLLDFGDDKAIIALMQAGLDADEPAMLAALPAARQACELHVTRFPSFSDRRAWRCRGRARVPDLLGSRSTRRTSKVPARSARKAAPDTHSHTA